MWIALASSYHTSAIGLFHLLMVQKSGIHQLTLVAYTTGWWLQRFFIPIWGKWSNLTSIFFKWVGWNHQLEVYQYIAIVDGSDPAKPVEVGSLSYHYLRRVFRYIPGGDFLAGFLLANSPCIQAPGAPELFRLHQADDGEVLLEFFWLGENGNMFLKEHKQKDFLSTGKVDSWILLKIAKCCALWVGCVMVV